MNVMDSVGTAKRTYGPYGGTTPFFSLNGLKTYARVVDVYDGDTLTLVLDINGSFLKFKTRVMGLDTCEMRSKNAKNKDLAVKARNRLIGMITGQVYDDLMNKKKDITQIFEEDVFVIWVHCSEFDKYGRLLADCYSSSDTPKSFATILIEEKLAYKYEGDTKLSEEQQVGVLL